MFFPGMDFHRMSDAGQIDVIIDLAIPWYIGFYVSWMEAIVHGDVDALWQTYEEVMDDKVGSIMTILEYYGLENHASGVADGIAALEKSNMIRLNVGISGKGRQLLTAGQVYRIYRQTRYYPSVDFSSILD